VRAPPFLSALLLPSCRCGEGGTGLHDEGGVCVCVCVCVALKPRSLKINIADKVVRPNIAVPCMVLSRLCHLSGRDAWPHGLQAPRSELVPGLRRSAPSFSIARGSSDSLHSPTHGPLIAVAEPASPVAPQTQTLTRKKTQIHVLFAFANAPPERPPPYRSRVASPAKARVLVS
jgi:hypothetical protein